MLFHIAVHAHTSSVQVALQTDWETFLFTLIKLRIKSYIALVEKCNLNQFCTNILWLSQVIDDRKSTPCNIIFLITELKFCRETQKNSNIQRNGSVYCTLQRGRVCVRIPVDQCTDTVCVCVCVCRQVCMNSGLGLNTNIQYSKVHYADFDCY